MCHKGTVRSALVWATGEFSRAQVDQPRLAAERLLGYVLGWDRAWILGHLEDLVDEGDWSEFAALACRRAAGEPLQYLTGEQEFYGLTFRTSPAVLIPRPETEILVEKTLALAGNLGSRPVQIVDVGTGSGCIAIAVAHGLPNAHGWGVDLSIGALAVARENAARHRVSNRIQFVCGDLLECFSPRPSFDFILSNPPYVARQEETSLPVTVRDYEPHVALFAGPSGMEVFLRLIPDSAARLKRGGYLLLEVGVGMAHKVMELIGREGLSPEGVLEDLQGIPRCIVSRRRHG